VLLKRGISLALISLLFLTLLPSQATAADPLAWTQGTGISVLNWSGKSTVSGQTGWRLSWKKTTEASYNNYYDFNSVATRSANVCMSYTGSEENYQIQTLVSGVAGNAYVNTWTYTGSLYTAVSPKPSCINPNEYDGTIAFNNNGGSGTMSSKSVFGSTTTLPANTFTKSTSPSVFMGWNTVANGSGIPFPDQATLDFSVVSFPTNLYAQWGTSVSQTISYNNGGGTGSAPVSPTSVNYGTSFTTPANTFTRTGYTFSNWSDGTTNYAAGVTYPATSVKGAVSLTATWSANSQTISYAAGTGGSGSAPVSPTSVNYGSTFVTPANTYSRSGYSFAGWSDGTNTYAAGATYPVSGTVTGNVTLTATWSLNSVTLTTPTAPTASATSNTLKSIAVSWSAIANASSYTLKLYNSSNTLLATIASLSGTSRTITTSDYASLADNTAYKVSLTAIGDGSNYLSSSESTKSDVTTNAAPVTPTISSHPANTSANYNSTATFSVTASVSDAGTLSYQWQVNTGSSWSDIAGATDSSYTTSTLAMSANNYQYRVNITNTKNGATSAAVTSNAATLTMNRASQSISSPVLSASSKNYPYSQSPLTVSSVTGGLGTGALSITSVANGTASGCAWDGTTLTATSAGTCTLTITKAQDDNYSAATTTATFTFNGATLTTPTAPTASATSNTLKSIAVSWSAIANASSYTLKLYNSSNTLLATIASLSGTSRTITTSDYASLADNTAYKVSLTAIGDGSNYLSSSESTKSDVTTNAAPVTPTISSHPANTSANYNSTATFSVSASVSDAGTLNYQWQVNTGSSWSDIAGATDSSYTTATLAMSANNYQYRVNITNTKNGATSAAVTSNAATLTMNRASQSISSPVLSASSKNYPYSQSPLTVSSVTGGLGTGALSITSVANGSASGCAWDGTTLTATSAGTCTLTITKAQDDNYSAATTTATFTFNGATLTTPSAPTASATSNTLKSIAVSWSAIANASSYTLKLYNSSNTLLATIASLSGTSRTITTSDYASLADNTAYKVSITAIGDGSNYLSSGESTKSDVTTNAAPVTPTISSHPANTSANYNSTATFSVSASVSDAGTLNYQWQVNTGSSWSDIAGATDSSYTTATLAMSANNYQYRVNITNTKNGATSAAVTSNAATLTMNRASQSISISSLGTASKSYPFSQTLNISTSGSSGIGSKTFSIASGGTATNCLLNGSSSTTSSSPILSASTIGTCLITVSIAQDANYSSATSSATTFTFSKTSQNALSSPVLSASSKSAPYSQSPLTVTSITGGSGTGAISITSVTNGSGSGCNWNGTTLTATEGGTCILTITKLGDSNYTDAQTTSTFTFKRSQAPLSISNSAVVAISNNPLTISTTGGSGTGTITFKVSGSNCTLTGGESNKLIVSSAATCLITATKSGDSLYDQIVSPAKTISISIGNLDFQSAPTSAPSAGPGSNNSTITSSITVTKMIYMQTNPITVSVDREAKITFLANGLTVPSCLNINSIQGIAICQYRPTQVGPIQISVTIKPVDKAYKEATKSLSVNVSLS
jgi:uncharacterized repeat protein (TIGR02543 family)